VVGKVGDRGGDGAMDPEEVKSCGGGICARVRCDVVGSVACFFSFCVSEQVFPLNGGREA
jgi:hypothetical protein